MPHEPNYKSKLTSEQIEDVHELLMDRTITYQQIQDEYKLTESDVQALTRDFGIQRRHRTAKSEPEPPPLPTTLDEATRQLEAAHRALREAQDKIAWLSQLKDTLAIQFEWDGRDVAVYGIGDGPFVASPEAWIRFLNNEGARKLRDFIGKRFQQ